MKKIFSAAIIFIIANTAFAQLPDDALRTAWFIPAGSARSMAIGGAMASLGGDISAANINPAGIGMYKTSEFVITPGFIHNNNEINFRGTGSTLANNTFAYGTTGFVSGRLDAYNKGRSSAFSISITQLASYNNHTYYKGLNNQSSYSEQYLEELTRDGADTYAAESNYIFGSSLAYRTYLIDSVNLNGQLIGYKTLASIATGLNQERDETTKGGYHELSLAFASNNNDQLYVGGSINVPIISYTRDLFFKESDATADPNNNFESSEYNEHFTSSGFGANLKLGLIYKPQKSIRLGLALHSPSFIAFKDRIRSSMITNTEAYAGLVSESSDNLNGGNPGERTYNMLTPWRAIISGSYVFGEAENTKRQKGFITADIEYVAYGGARFFVSDQADVTGSNYYDALNSTVKDYYKGNVNFRVGGELKFDPIAVRLGGAYYGNPYSDNTLKARRLQASGGIGYRRHGIFVDLTYIQTFNKDVNFPYRLNDKPNTFATWDNNRSNVVLTFGIKI